MKQPVAVDYAMKKDGTVAFVVGNYDTSQTLVIDPILAYSTYLGGSQHRCGEARSPSPRMELRSLRAARHRLTFRRRTRFSRMRRADDGPQDAFVSKLSADGSTLLYSTYLGGSATDVADGIAVDTFGNAYVTGTTFSTDFPIVNASNPECGGDGECGATFNTLHRIVTNAFVSKLNTAGSALDYSTYLGEYENVAGAAIAVDGDQNAYVTGYTGPNFVPTVVITPPALPPPPFPIINGFQTIAVDDGRFYNRIYGRRRARLLELPRRYYRCRGRWSRYRRRHQRRRVHHRTRVLDGFSDDRDGAASDIWRRRRRILDEGQYNSRGYFLAGVLDVHRWSRT